MFKPVLLAMSFDSGTIVIALIISLLIFIAVFLIIRGIVLWYWKINVIVQNQERQTALLSQLHEKQSRNEARVSYYTHRALGDNKKARKYLLYMVFHDLTFHNLNKEEKQQKYNNLKEHYAGAFQSLGYDFPDYPY